MMIQSVKITEQAYKDMFRYVIDFANPNRPYRQWREVIGWLIGQITEDTITVLKAIPMSSGNSIFVEMDDYTIIPKIAEEAEKINAVIVGWFHSHPSFGFFLSGVDIRTQRYQQSLFENAIALVCDPTKINSYEPGVHGYQVHMDQMHAREYRELDISVDIGDPYPDVLTEILMEKGIDRSYSDVIAYEELAALYALEGISPPAFAADKIGDLLPVERSAVPELVADYIISSPFRHKKESFVQIKISNIGEGIAYVVDFTYPRSFDYKIISMYPRRIIDQLNYDSTIIEHFKIKPLIDKEILLPSVTIYYRTINQKRYQITIPSRSYKVL
ncbi:MAG: hypothetical protein FK734_16840 [Asgard group archaeon]|nr:hypothetical protein [Asgard group archaeon]